MNGRKSVLFVMNTMGRAGAERALVELLYAMDPNRYRIYLYVLIPRGELFAEVPEYVTILNRRTDERSVLSGSGKLFVAGCLLRAAFCGGAGKALGRQRRNRWKETDRCGSGQRLEKLLRRMLADGTPAIRHTFDYAVAYLEGPATWYVARKVSAGKKAAFLHVDYSRAGYTKGLDEGCYDTMDKIYAVSSNVRKGFLRVYPQYEKKTETFFNLVNRECIEEKAREPGGFTDHYEGIRILTVGRLYYQKGYDIAIRTAEILRDRGRDFRWYVLGEGEEHRHLEKMIDACDLENRFFLLGVKDNPYPWFSQADIYVCTSRYEGKSIVIEEAQALGKPVVAADCTGIREQISTGKDGMIAGNTPEQIADAVEKLMEDPVLGRVLGKAAREKTFGQEKKAASFLEEW